MAVEPLYAARARSVHDALVSRCAVLGIPVWHCDPSGQIIVTPETVQPWLAKDGKELAVRDGLRQLCAAEDPVPIQVLPGCWFIPLEDRPGAHRIAMNAALLVSGEAASVPDGAVRRTQDEIDRLGKALRTMFDDLARAEQDGRTIEQFGEKLAQAYEETNLLYRMARLFNSVDDPLLSMSAITSQLQQVLPFGWVAVYIGEDPVCISELRNQLVLVGDCPADSNMLQQQARAIVDKGTVDDWTRIADPHTHPLARAVGSELLAEPITHDARVIGLLLAGNKRGPDPELSSFETQFVDAIADFLGIFHENLSRFAEQRRMFLGTLRALTAAIDAKDTYTRGHSERVALLAAQMAAALGMGKQTIEEYRIAGNVHDVGKIGVPEAVLTKPQPLTNDEFALIKKHPEIGYHIIRAIPSLESALPGVLHHHERWDGRGYPHGLSAHDIPLVARVLALADTFDAMSSKRAYRPALPRAAVLQEIRRCAGSQFDPDLVPHFISLDFSEFDATLESQGLLAHRAA